MLIVTAKLSRRKLALWSAVVVGLVCCALLLTSGSSLPTLGSGDPANPKGIKTNADRIQFLSNYGWQVSPDPIAVEELLVPEVFDDSYREYLALQSGQGFDLTALAGKCLKRYTYQITNHPTGEQTVHANLLVHKNTVVGGEVFSPTIDGLFHGLAMPTS